MQAGLAGKSFFQRCTAQSRGMLPQKILKIYMLADAFLGTIV